MTGIHIIKFVKDDKKQGSVVKRRAIEAIELNPFFSRLKDHRSALTEIAEWLSTAKHGDKIVIETELEE